MNREDVGSGPLVGQGQLQEGEIAARPADELKPAGGPDAEKPAATLIAGSPAKVGMTTTSIQR